MSRDDLERRRPSDAPPRLIDDGGHVAAGLRALDARTRPDGQDEAAAWRRLMAPWQVTGARRWFWSGALVAAAVAVVVVVGRRPGPPLSAGAVGTPPATLSEEGLAQGSADARQRGTGVGPAVAGQRERRLDPPLPRLALSARPTSIASGRSALADEATVEVAEGSAARASADQTWVRVLLDEGEVGLHVRKRVPGGPGFEVVAGEYHFRVLGTTFRVARNAHDGPPVELWVEEGRVAVSHEGRALGVVAAGGHWDTSDEARAAPSPTSTGAERSRPARHASASSGAIAAHASASSSAAAAHASASPGVDHGAPTTCAGLAADAATARDAVACYLAVARGGDLAAETALFEIARLRRDVLGDGAGALAALQESRTRFPAGVLRDDVDLSIVELLADLNRHNEAIEEIGRLLADGHGVERNAELWEMRGDIYREVLEDYGHAERDYAAAEQARAPVVGDATFFRGVCLQALGRNAEARATFGRYLAAGTARFADEAGRRLRRLGR
ncbi:MAG TPA: FecR domain-containing protein [Polyangia bacterium]|nr:FecR domain-containing protein [Polyangia bacterium]